MDNTELIITLFKVFIIAGIFSFIIFVWLQSVNKQNKKRWEAINPDNAAKMIYHGLDITPNEGDFFVKVSEFQWVHLFWDKKGEYLCIQRPPDIQTHRKDNPIWIEERNWKVVAERQPTRVSVKDYFVRQVM